MPETDEEKPLKDVTQNVTDKTKIILAGHAGGRCEYGGCNRFLFEHHVDFGQGNYGQGAHIYASSKNGPRGNEPGRPVDINKIENLIYACYPCHRKIDTEPLEHTVTELMQQKKEHEERVRFMTEVTDDRTAILVLQAPIRGKAASINANRTILTVMPDRYPAAKEPFLIDLSGHTLTDPNSYESAARVIKDGVDLFYRTKEFAKTQHQSIFALGPIPILIYLGSRLGGPILTDFFQKHRDEDWKWSEEGEVTEYSIEKVQEGSDPSKVGLILSLSGVIDRSHLPPDADSRFTIYEMTLSNMTPDPGFLSRKESLIRFSEKYREFLAQIVRDHTEATDLHLFPAIPAPVAVRCGFERLAEVQHNLVVYNDNGDGFNHLLTINDYGNQ